MGHAQSALELAYELRGSAMTEIAEEMSTALGDVGAEKATTEIAEQMQKLLASDVIYATVVRPEINGVLADNGIDGDDVPKSVFLPDGTKWLDESEVSAALGSVSGASGGEKPRASTASACSAPASTAPNSPPKRHRGRSAKKRPKSKSKSRTRANRPRTGSPSRSPSAAATPSTGTIDSIGAGRNRTVVDPADAGAERRSDARSRGRDGARRGGLREQRSQLHGRLRIGGGAERVRIAYLGPAGTFTEDALRRGRAGGRVSSRCARRRSTTRSSRSSAARPSGPGPLRELDRGLGAAARSTRSPSRPAR